MKDELYQIGIPAEYLSTAMMYWMYYEPIERILLSPSCKTKGWIVIESRHTDFASAVIKNIPQTKLKILDQPIKIINL